MLHQGRGCFLRATWGLDLEQETIDPKLLPPATPFLVAETLTIIPSPVLLGLGSLPSPARLAFSVSSDSC